PTSELGQHHPRRLPVVQHRVVVGGVSRLRPRRDGGGGQRRCRPLARGVESAAASGPMMSRPTAPALLEVQDLRTWFHTGAGVARAVDGVSFTIDAGETVGLVGESGCGKSVTALSLLRLIEPPGRIEPGSRVVFEGQDLLALDDAAMRRVRGNRIAMVFQEPMTALNPVFTIGDQVAEV